MVFRTSSDPPAVATIDADAVVWANRYADIGGFVLTPSSPLGVPMTSTIVSVRLNDKPRLAATVIFLLHQLKLWPVATRWSRRFRRWWRWEQCRVLGDLQR